MYELWTELIYFKICELNFELVHVESELSQHWYNMYVYNTRSWAKTYGNNITFIFITRWCINNWSGSCTDNARVESSVKSPPAHPKGFQGLNSEVPIHLWTWFFMFPPNHSFPLWAQWILTLSSWNMAMKCLPTCLFKKLKATHSII